MLSSSGTLNASEVDRYRGGGDALPFVLPGPRLPSSSARVSAPLLAPPAPSPAAMPAGSGPSGVPTALPVARPVKPVSSGAGGMAVAVVRGGRSPSASGTAANDPAARSGSGPRGSISGAAAADGKRGAPSPASAAASTPPPAAIPLD